MPPRPAYVSHQNDPGKLLERVHKIARRAYKGVGNGTVLGNISLAAPVLNHGRMTVDAAINISLFTSRWSVERVEAELARQVQVAATSISKALLASGRR